jgi:ABC-type Fe3+/spermidine/putrescine transport system ATPase subunit
MEGLVLQTITAGYGDKVVIKDISLHIDGKEAFVLMGVSGSGKTTLLRTILGLIKPIKGTIRLNNEDITNASIEIRNIGYMPQDYGLFPHLTVGENIAYGLQTRDVPLDEQTAIVEKILDQMQLKGFENNNVQDLSSGQQQRIGLGRALAINPSLLLLDEPMTNIDQDTKLKVARELKKIFDALKIPVIIVTHNYEDALFLGEKVGIMIDGVLEQIGSYQELIDHPKNPTVKRLLTPFFEH